MPEKTRNLADGTPSATFSGIAIANLSKAEIKNTSVLVCLSIKGNPHCVADDLKAIIDHAVTDHKHTTFLIGDETHWHNLKNKAGVTETEKTILKEKAIAMGSIYLKNNLPAFLAIITKQCPQFNIEAWLLNNRTNPPSDLATAVNLLATQLSVPFQIVRWHEWVANEAYIAKRAQIMALYQTEETLCSGLEACTTDFARRHKGCGLIKISTDPETMTDEELLLLMKNKPSYVLFGLKIYYIDKNTTKVRLETEDIEQVKEIFTGLTNQLQEPSEVDLLKIKSLTGHSQELLKECSRDYLNDETPAIFWIAAARSFDFVAYPGKMVKLFQATRDFFVTRQGSTEHAALRIQVENPDALASWLEIKIKIKHPDLADRNTVDLSQAHPPQDVVRRLDYNSRSTAFSITASTPQRQISPGGKPGFFQPEAKVARTGDEQGKPDLQIMIELLDVQLRSYTDGGIPSKQAFALARVLVGWTNYLMSRPETPAVAVTSP